MENLIKRAAEDIAAAKRVTALTGAGISTESGIPPFRGKGGLWDRFDPMEVAHIDAFMQNPARIWDILLKEMKIVVDTARPNDSHTGLKKLENLGKLSTIITQNVDGLHQAAGSSDVIEFHGNFASHRCLDCQKQYASREVRLTHIPPRCDCNGILRPNAVFFGELIPPEALRRSQKAATDCDLMLVLGTSAEVQPAAMMPVIAKNAGATIIEINPQSTALTGTVSDYLIKGKAGEVMNRIIAELKKLI